MSQFSWSVPPEIGPGTRGPKPVSVARLQGALAMLRTHRRIVAAVAIVVAGLFVMKGSTPADPSVTHDTSGTAAEVQPAAPPSPAATTTPVLDGRPTYWIGDHELEGAHDSLTLGVPVEIWVTWSPPLTKEIQVQKLIDDAYVAAVLPPTTPDGLFELGIALKQRDIRRMIYGERFGELTVVEKRL